MTFTPPAGDPQAVLMSAAGRVRGGEGTELGLRLHMVASRWQVRAQDELALETACLDATVRVGDLVERNALGDARPDRVSGEQPEEPFQILVEPAGMSRPHRINRVEARVFPAG